MEFDALTPLTYNIDAFYAECINPCGAVARICWENQVSIMDADVPAPCITGVSEGMVLTM